MLTCLSEFVGTALLVAVGLSIVIGINGTGSPFLSWIPGAGPRRALTGALFGTTGCLIALSPIGKISGAHINPIVSIAFGLKGKMKFNHVLGFVIAQMAGALAGACTLLPWNRQGASIRFGATEPGPAGILPAFAGETITSFLLIAGILFFTGHRRFRRWTPYLMPFLYCFMVYAEGNLSGTSTNPARSFGPAVISGCWNSYGLYWAAPLTGMLMALVLFKMPLFRNWKTIIPKINQSGKGSKLFQGQGPVQTTGPGDL